MTPKGPQLVEQEMLEGAESEDDLDDGTSSVATKRVAGGPLPASASTPALGNGKDAARSPIADLLLNRWLEGLKRAIGA